MSLFHTQCLSAPQPTSTLPLSLGTRFLHLLYLEDILVYLGFAYQAAQPTPILKDQLHNQSVNLGKFFIDFLIADKVLANIRNTTSAKSI